MENYMPLRSLAVRLMVLSLSPFSLSLHELSVRNLMGGYTNCADRLYIFLGRVSLGRVWLPFVISPPFRPGAFVGPFRPGAIVLFHVLFIARLFSVCSVHFFSCTFLLPPLSRIFPVLARET